MAFGLPGQGFFSDTDRKVSLTQTESFPDTDRNSFFPDTDRKDFLDTDRKDFPDTDREFFELYG